MFIVDLFFEACLYVSIVFYFCFVGYYFLLIPLIAFLKKKRDIYREDRERIAVKKEMDKDPRRVLWKRLMKEGCINCGCKKFNEGPTAGLSENVACVECGKKYNITIVFEFAQEI